MLFLAKRMWPHIYVHLAPTRPQTCGSSLAGIQQVKKESSNLRICVNLAPSPLRLTLAPDVRIEISESGTGILCKMKGEVMEHVTDSRSPHFFEPTGLSAAT